MPPKKDYYAILGILRSASQSEIKQAYLEAARRLHPDKNTRAGETELFLDIQQAYETLSNPKQRAKYDAKLPPEEKPALPVNYKVHYSRPNLVCMDEAQMLYILLEIEPAQMADQLPAPPLNVSLVLDRSTSMKGEKMDVLKSAAIQVLRSLREQDILSVIVFSDRAEVLIPAAFRVDKNRLEQRIQMLQSSGATEIFQGLETGFNQLQQNATPDRLNHMILMTDGHTYGDEENCIALAKQAAGHGIGISTMGIGKEWNDHLLDHLASLTGGSSRYIANAKDIQRFLLEKFEKLANVLVEDVLLDFRVDNGIELAYAFRTQPEAGPVTIESPIHLGPVLQDTPLAILFEYKIAPPLTQDTIRLLQGSLKLAMPSQPLPVPPLPIEFTRPIQKKAGLEPTPSVIVQSLGKLTLYRMQEKAHSEVKAGQFELAARHMSQLATNLLALGEDGLAHTAMIEAGNIEQLKSLSEEGSKAIKYGTRSLLSINEKVSTQ